MQTHELTSAVRRSAGIGSHQDARKAVRATLTVLGRRLSTEADDLAARLPPELGDRLRGEEEVQRFDVEEFHRRVAAEEDCSPEEARRHARAVTAALREAVGAEYRHLLAQLPDGHGDLVHTGNAQH